LNGENNTEGKKKKKERSKILQPLEYGTLAPP